MTIEQIETLLNVTIFVFVFLFGITIGSFLNVCILRLPRGESLITNNSHCMTCGTEIKRYDLIPVFSWLILRGRCRACGARISPRYMLVELLTGVTFLAVFWRYGYEQWGLYPVLLCLFLSGLIVLCFQDIDNREMCLSVLIYTAIIAIITRIMGLTGIVTLPDGSIKSALLGMAVVSLVLFIFGFVFTPLFYRWFVSEERAELRLVKRQLKAVPESGGEHKKLTDKRLSLERKIKDEPPVYGFGMGDIFLMAAGGLMLGFKASLTAGFIAVVTGAVYGIVRRITCDSDSEDANVFAFGPFIIIGLAAAAFVNGSLADLYIGSVTLPQ